MTCTDRFTGGKETFDQCNRLRIVHQIPHRAVTTGVEDGVKVIRSHIRQFHGGVQRGRRLGICLKAVGVFGLEIRLIALGVQRRQPPFGRRQRQLKPRIDKGVVGRGQLFQPETSRTTSIAELVM